MKFTFRLETLMRKRKTDQDEAQREYADAQDRVQKQIKRINDIYYDIDGARERSEQLAKNGPTSPSEFLQLDEFIEGQHIRLAREKEVVRELMLTAEEKHEALVEKMQEFKVLEKLKEKKKVEFKKMKLKKMTKSFDDITMARVAGKKENL